MSYCLREVQDYDNCMYPRGGEVDLALRARQIKLETEAEDRAAPKPYNNDPFAEQLKEYNQKQDEVSEKKSSPESEEYALPVSTEDCESAR